MLKKRTESVQWQASSPQTNKQNKGTEEHPKTIHRPVGSLPRDGELYLFNGKCKLNQKIDPNKEKIYFSTIYPRKSFKNT